MTSAHGLAALIGAAPLIAALQLPAPAAGPLAAIFPPWWSADRVLAAAASAGELVRYGTVPFVAVVAPDQPGALLRARLRAAGALLVLDPIVAGGCGAPRRATEHPHPISAGASS